jgi:hypothetical protein
MTAVLDNAAGLLGAAEEVLDGWLLSKGSAAPEAPEVLLLQDGRKAQVETRRFAAPNGEWRETRLTEPTAAGVFQTSLVVERREDTVGLYCSLRAGAATSDVAPTRFEVRCPIVVRRTIGLCGGWAYR